MNTWEWVDLTTLGSLDSVSFRLSSSDVGSFGMNTPAFFCIDEFNKQNVGLAEVEKDTYLSLYPNPATSQITVINSFSEDAQLTITDMTGKVVYTELLVNETNRINVENLANGSYIARLAANNIIQTSRLIITK